MDYTDAISLREYAKMSGVSEGYIRKLRDKGRLSSSAFVIPPGSNRPMIIPSVADAEWGTDYLAKKGKTKNERSASSAKTIVIVPSPTPAPAAKIENKDDDGELDISIEDIVDDEGLPIVLAEMSSFHADRVKRILEAMTLKVKLRQVNGELVEKKEVYKELFLFAQEMRAELQNIPERIIDDVMAADTRNKGYLILSGEIDKVLEKLSTNSKTVLE